MSKQYTTNRTEIPVNILTDYEHKTGDRLETVRQQVEISGFHLQTLFNNLKRSALFMENHFSDNETDHIRGFCSDLMNTADIGNALCMTVWKSISDLTEIQMNDENQNEIEKPPQVKTSTIETIAEKISFLITSADVPPEISEALFDGVTEAMNASKQSEVLEYEQSSEYIAKVLRDYKNK